MIQPHKTDGVVVTITSRDRLPDVLQFLEGEWASERRNVGVDLLEWCAVEIRYQRSLNKRYRELDEAS
jgi:hypothetical protein